MSRTFIAIALSIIVNSSAQAVLVDRFAFDNPVAGDSTREADLGSDQTPVQLFNGAPRVAGGAFPGSGFALQSGPVADPPVNNDWKAGVHFSTGSTLTGTAGVTGITIMGWFKPTVMPNGTTSMVGVLRGDLGNANTFHDGRALMEIELSGGQPHLIALGRRLDTEGSARPISISTDVLTTVMPLNQWTHITAVFDYDAPSIKLYRNGVLIPASTPTFTDWALTAGLDTTSNSPSDGIKIGGQLDDDTTPFTGFIDEVRVYNTALPATGMDSVQSVYQSQVPEPALMLIPATWLLALNRHKER